MADMISILIFMIFAYFAIKKFVIPRIAAKRAAKKDGTSTADLPITVEGMQPPQAAMTATPGHHPVTCFDMRIVDSTLCNYDENGTEKDMEAFTQRMKYAASELLLNASTRGDNVRLSAINWKCYILLYVTYTVR